jgi:XTP/dITP diphosphohydrolase
MTSTADAFLKLVGIMDELREKCPWDKKQTIHSLRQMTLEEVYELADALTETNWPAIKEELGDLLLHLLFYCKIATEQKHFRLEDVIEGITKKLIVRHPHIYGDAQNPGNVTALNNAEDVKKNWEQIKLKEGKASVLSGIPKNFPSLIKSMRLQEKAKQVGFEWENKDQVWEKVEEEIAELHHAIQEKDQSKIEEEFGDILFSLVNFARFLKIDADKALEITNKKFISRFTKMEIMASEKGTSLNAMSLTELDNLWNEIKKQ